MQVGTSSVSENTVVDGSAHNAQAVARLLRQAPFEEPRVVSFDMDFLAPKAPMAFAGQTSGIER
jgi:hypothetical protein